MLFSGQLGLFFLAYMCENDTGRGVFYSFLGVFMSIEQFYSLCFVVLVLLNEDDLPKLLFVLVGFALFNIGNLFPVEWFYSGSVFAISALLMMITGFGLWSIYRENKRLYSMAFPIFTLLLIGSCAQLSFLTYFYLSDSIQKIYIHNTNYIFMSVLTAIEIVVLLGHSNGIDRLYNLVRDNLRKLSHSN